MPILYIRMDDNRLEEAILKTLIYFSVFSHPLTRQEIRNYLAIQANETEVEHALNALLEQSLIAVEDEYYGLINHNIQTHTSQRINYETLFNQTISKAHKSTKLIAKFPFVKGIFISGSMSKGVVKEDGDIDFFIITTSNRLWICRSLLIAYKKICKLNSHKYFCLNYFVGTDSLNIPDENIFTATEIATMIPMYNIPVCTAFKQENKWHEAFFPNYQATPLISPIKQQKKNFMASFIEQMLSYGFGDTLDRFLMRLTLKKWVNKFPEFTTEMLELAMRSKRNVSKHHPNNFQEKVLQAITEKELLFCPKLKTYKHV